MAISITPLYAVFLVLIYFVLTARVIAERRQSKFAYGDNGSPRVQAKIRAQANWAEYVPITLILLLIAELNGAASWALHLTGLLLLIGRGLHAYSMSFNPKQLAGRVYGMMLTTAAIGIATGLNILQFL